VIVKSPDPLDAYIDAVRRPCAAGRGGLESRRSGHLEVSLSLARLVVNSHCPDETSLPVSLRLISP